jgi:predicted DNA-binding protein
MADTVPHYTFRTSRNVLDKLDYVSKYNGRSKNKELEMLVKRHIHEFENQHGKIDLSCKDEWK